jgi:hypothetical protein
VVRAIKHTTDGGKTMTTIYLEKYKADAKARLAEMKPDDPKRAETEKEGLLVRSPAPGSPWVPAQSPMGEKLRNPPKPAPK